MELSMIEVAAAKPRHPFGLPVNVFFLGLTSFFNDISSEMIFTLLPLFSNQYFGRFNRYCRLDWRYIRQLRRPF